MTTHHHEDQEDSSPFTKSLSLDYLNLLINGQAFSDVTFNVDGHIIHAHKCILVARSPFFRKFFSSDSSAHALGLSNTREMVIPVHAIGYEVFMVVLQFLYSGQVTIVPSSSSHEKNRDHGHVSHCAASDVDLALETLSAALTFGVEQLVLLTQKQLASMVEKASIEDVMKVLITSRKQDMHQLWTTCSHLVAKSGLPTDILAKHLPVDVVSKIEDIRLKCRQSSSMQRHHFGNASANLLADQKNRRMRHALDSSDVELVKLMVVGEGLNLDEALALHYAVENCTREIVKALLELGAADVNHPAGPLGKTALHIASEMVSPDMVAVLLDHHADPNVRTVDGVTPLDILRTLTSDFLFKGVVPGLTHIEPNKLRLCLELVQSAALVISREEEASCRDNNNNNVSTNNQIYSSSQQGGNCDSSMYVHHRHHSHGHHY